MNDECIVLAKFSDDPIEAARKLVADLQSTNDAAFAAANGDEDARFVANLRNSHAIENIADWAVNFNDIALLLAEIDLRDAELME